jgi:hypothetical protein
MFSVTGFANYTHSTYFSKKKKEKGKKWQLKGQSLILVTFKVLFVIVIFFQTGDNRGATYSRLARAPIGTNLILIEMLPSANQGCPQCLISNGG